MSLHVDRFPIDIPLIDDGHDDGVARLVLGHRCLSGGAPACIQHNLVDPGADAVDSNDIPTLGGPGFVELAHDEQGQSLKQGFLA
jgi:hypothetical protein